MTQTLYDSRKLPPTPPPTNTSKTDEETDIKEWGYGGEILVGDMWSRQMPVLHIA
jgi:hypothetical protein